MSDDLIQAAMKECGLDFAKLADEKDKTQPCVPNDVNILENLNTKIGNENINLYENNQLISGTGLKDIMLNPVNMCHPVLIPNRNQPIVWNVPNKVNNILQNVKKPIQTKKNDLEKRFPNFIINQNTPPQSLSHPKNIKFINLPRPNSPVILKPKSIHTSVLSNNLTDKKVVKVILKPNSSQVPLIYPAQPSSSSLNKVSLSSQPNKFTYVQNISTLKNKNSHLSNPIQAKIIVPKPASPLFQLTSKNVASKSDIVLPKSNVNISKTSSTIYLTATVASISSMTHPMQQMNANSMLRINSLPKTSSTNSLSTIKLLTKTPITLSSHPLKKLPTTCIEPKIVSMARNTTLSTFSSSFINSSVHNLSELNEDERVTSSPTVKFHLGPLEEDCDNKNINNINNNNLFFKNIVTSPITTINATESVNSQETSVNSINNNTLINTLKNGSIKNESKEMEIKNSFNSNNNVTNNHNNNTSLINSISTKEKEGDKIDNSENAIKKESNYDGKKVDGEKGDGKKYEGKKDNEVKDEYTKSKKMDGICDFFEALQELKETNKKVEEIEAKLKEEEEEKESAKKVKQLLNSNNNHHNNDIDITMSSISSLTEQDNHEKIVVVDDEDDTTDYNNNNINHSTNILEFGRSFNNRYLPQNSNNKFNGILFDNNNKLITGSNNNSNNGNMSGGISLIKSGFNFNRGYSILRPGDLLSHNHNINMNKTGIEDELEEEEMGHAETFAAYMPTKLKIGLQHPDAVVESASLSSVEAPDIEYNLSIPEICADEGYLSAVQLETITYACQKHENTLPNGERVGFLVGDGAGVGKGRTIAGIIYENYIRGRRRSLWLSVSSDLKVDAERDLRDIGASSIPVYSLNKFKYTKISSKINGKVKKGVIFSTYSALIGESKANNKYRTRLKQLTHWLGKEFDGLIIFDECHRAKNLFPNGSSKPTKTGKTVVELQKRLPKSRVVYASATGASEPRNMAYMVRLGLWGPGTPFKEFADFIHAVEKRGVGTMEMVAMEMKQRGTYIARQLSFMGVSFRVEEVIMQEMYVDMYNQAVQLWVEARDKFQQSTKLLELDKHQMKVIWSQFWSAHQRFFKYLCISGKVRHCVAIAKKAIEDGKCVVIGLQSTGESRILDVVEEQGDELTDFVSSSKGVFQKLVETHFPEGHSVKDQPCTPTITTINNNYKRKVTLDAKTPRKKFKKGDSSSDNEGVKANGDNSDEGSEDSSGDDDDDSDDEEEESSSDSESDSNPFANGSDSDCDAPWVRRKKHKPEKKEKAKKSKKRSKKEKQKKEDDDDSECEYDKDVNRILEAFKKKENMDRVNKAKPPSIKTSSKLNNHVTNMNGGCDDEVEMVINMKKDLLHKIDLLGQILPPNTLDQLIDLFEGPSKVAEMTGRKGRVVCGQDGSIRYEKRSVDDVSLEMLNLTEKQRFMDGEKNIAIISEAASSGISLQADRRAINQRRRVHITLELPWSADRAIQQFGRTHRSNQVSAPEYIFLISDLAGERRFASTVSKRLESLGALTHGDRRAAEARDLSQFNIDNKFGQAALESVMKSVIGDKPMVPIPHVTDQNLFFQEVRRGLVGVGMVYHNKFGFSLDKESYNISKFLNRILGIEVSTQNLLFTYFSATLKHIMLDAKKNGKWDMGILDLGSTGEKVMQLSSQDFYGFFSGSKTKITLNKVSVERGLSWKDAEKVHSTLEGDQEGFYVSKQTYVKKRKMYILAQVTRKHKDTFYKIFRANTGLQTKLWSLGELRQKYRKATDEREVRLAWLEQFNLSEQQCLHYYQYAKCNNATSCEIGRRCRTYHILSGSVLSFWTSVERVLSSSSGQTSKMQIVRARMKDDKRIVGILIHTNAINSLIQLLKTGHLDETQSNPLPHSSMQQQAFIQQPQQNSYPKNNFQPPQVFNQQQLVAQQQFKQQQQKEKLKIQLQQTQQNDQQNCINYSFLSPLQKSKLQFQQQQKQIQNQQQFKLQHSQKQQQLLQQQLLQQKLQQQRLLSQPTVSISPRPRFVYSLSSSSLQQPNNNNLENNINNINVKYINNNLNDNRVASQTNHQTITNQNRSISVIKSSPNMNNIIQNNNINNSNNINNKNFNSIYNNNLVIRTNNNIINSNNNVMDLNTVNIINNKNNNNNHSKVILNNNNKNISNSVVLKPTTVIRPKTPTFTIVPASSLSSLTNKRH